MATLDRKDKNNNSGDKHSLSSLSEKKRGAKIVFAAQKQKNKKYRVSNVQKFDGNNAPVGRISDTTHSENTKSVSATASVKQTNQIRHNSYSEYKNEQESTQNTEQMKKSAYIEGHSDIPKAEPEKNITPEMAQRMKRAAYVMAQNDEKIKVNTARTDFTDKTEHIEESREEKESEHKAENTSPKESMPVEHKYLSQTSDSIIPEQKRVITPEMALRMKRAAYIEQRNAEAIRMNRITASETPENQEYTPENTENYPDETADVPLEHHEDEQENRQPESSYLGNSDRAVFETYDNDVRSYRAKTAYSEYIKKHKHIEGEKSKSENDFLSVSNCIGENNQKAIDDIGTVSQAVKNSDSIGGSVLDVSSTLAAIEAKKAVKKLAETDLKKKERVDERLEHHGNRFGIDKYDEVTKKDEKVKKSKDKSDSRHETSEQKQNSFKVGNSNKHSEEKQEYYKKQRTKEIKSKQKDIFIKEQRKISNTLYSGAVGKAELAKQVIKKKGASVLVGGGGVAAILPIIAIVIIFTLIAAFFGWLSPFTYTLAGEEPDNEHNAETKAEVIDGYVLMVKNYMDIAQATYYLEYGDWYGGAYSWESNNLDYASFFAEYCQTLVAQIQAQYQPLIDNAATPQQAMFISQAMATAISQALANAQQAAMQEYSNLIAELDDEYTPAESRQPYEVSVSTIVDGIDDAAQFNGLPIVGTNHFGNKEINSELSAEELLSYIALYKSLLTLNPDESETETDPDADDEEPEVNITPNDIMKFFEDTEFISITTEITHDHFCINENCKRRLCGDAESGYSWEYYCDGDHDSLSGEIGACKTADELLSKIIELTGAEDVGMDEENCKKLIDSYMDMFKKELDIDEADFRKFGAADNTTALDFYEKMITNELPNADLWDVPTPFDNEG